MHTSVLLVTASVSYCVSAGMTISFHIQVPPQLWKNSTNDCSSAASVLWSGAPVSLRRRAQSADSVTMAGFLGGSLYGMVRSLCYFLDVCPSILTGK